MNRITRMLMFGILCLLMLAVVHADDTVDNAMKYLTLSPEFKIFGYNDDLSTALQLMYDNSSIVVGSGFSDSKSTITTTYDPYKFDSKPYFLIEKIKNGSTTYFGVYYVAGVQENSAKVITPFNVNDVKSPDSFSFSNRYIFTSYLLKCNWNKPKTGGLYRIDFQNQGILTFDSLYRGCLREDGALDILDSPIYTYGYDTKTFSSADLLKFNYQLTPELRAIQKFFNNEYIKLRTSGNYVVKIKDDLEKALNVVKIELEQGNEAAIATIQLDHQSQQSLVVAHFYKGGSVDLIRFDPLSESWKLFDLTSAPNGIDGINKDWLLKELQSQPKLSGVPPVYEFTELLSMMDSIKDDIMLAYIPQSMEIDVFTNRAETSGSIQVSNDSSNPKSYSKTTLLDPNQIEFKMVNLTWTNQKEKDFDQKLYITATDFKKGQEVDLSDHYDLEKYDLKSEKYYSFTRPGNNCQLNEIGGQFFNCLMLFKTIDGAPFSAGHIYSFKYYYGIKDPTTVEPSEIKAFGIQFNDTCEVIPGVTPVPTSPEDTGGTTTKVVTEFGSRESLLTPKDSLPETTITTAPSSSPHAPPIPTSILPPGTTSTAAGSAPVPSTAPSGAGSSTGAGVGVPSIIKISQNSGIVNPISSTDTLEVYRLPAAQPFQVYTENLDLGLEEPYIGSGGFGWGRIYYGWFPGTKTTVHKNFYLGETSRFKIGGITGIIFGTLPYEGSERTYQIPTSTGVLPMKAQAVNIKIGDMFNQLYSVASNENGLYTFLTNNFNGSTYYIFAFESMNGKSIAEYFSTNSMLEFSYYYDKDGDGKIGTGEVKTVQIYSPTSTVTAPPSTTTTAGTSGTSPPGTTGSPPSSTPATGTSPPSATSTGPPVIVPPLPVAPTCAAPTIKTNIQSDDQVRSEFYQKFKKALKAKDVPKKP